MLSCFWAFINICIDEGELWKIIAQSMECREDFTAHAAPRGAIIDNSGSFGGFDVEEDVSEVIVGGSSFEVGMRGER